MPDIIDDDIERLGHLIAKRRIAEIGTGHPVMDPLAGLTDMLGHIGEKRDDVMIERRLEFIEVA